MKMQLALKFQIATFSASLVIVPLATAMTGLIWVFTFLGFPLLLSAVILKLCRMNEQGSLKEKLKKTQIAFLVPYGLFILAAYFIVLQQENSTIGINPEDSSTVGPGVTAVVVIRLFLQFFIFSLAASSETIQKREYIAYMICLYFWIISFGFMTVYTIKLGDSDKINEETKDLSILVCTTIIASGILIMDIISRAMEEKNKIKEEHKEDDKIQKKEIEMPMIQS